MADAVIEAIWGARMRRLLVTTACVCIAALFGCANFNTVGRRTDLGLTSGIVKVDPDTIRSSGQAIHLDIQQRLAIVNGLGRFCAEPSPDALAAYAAAIGLSASVPAKGTGTLTQSGSSSAASVGLRTQSITLMRDGLYRMCEAYVNGQLSPAQVMTFLSRSQDLTAVVLAVEQLTGPVAARQAQLGGSARADATATAASVGKAVDALTKHKQRLTDRKEKLTREKGSLTAEQTNLNLTEKQTDFGAADEALKAAEDPGEGASPDPEQIEGLTRERNKAKEALDAATKRNNEITQELDAVETLISDVDAQIAKADERLAELEAKEDEAFAATSASTTSTGSFDSSDGLDRLTSDVSEVAVRVESIVKAVLDKDYVLEGCMAIITLPTDENDEAGKRAKSECFRLLRARATNEIPKAVGPSRDLLSACIENWAFATNENGDTTRAWVKRKGLASLRILTDTRVPELRQEFIGDNNVQCN